MMSIESEHAIQSAIHRWENEGGAIPPEERPDGNFRSKEEELLADTFGPTPDSP